MNSKSMPYISIKRAWLTLALAAFTLVTLSSRAQAFDVKEFEKQVVEYTLDNGLRLLIVERSDAPVASLVTYANVGSVDDPKGFSGMAHVFEHMAFKGDHEIGTNDDAAEQKAIAAEEEAFLAWRTERNKGRLADSSKLTKLEKTFHDAQEYCDQYVTTNEFGNIVEKAGFVGLNAFTGLDQTGYLYNFPENKLELAMMMEASRFSNPVMREYHKEVNVVKEERRMRTESNPIGRLIEEFLTAAFKAHPYGVPTIGHMSDLGNYSRAEALAFFKKYYNPNNLCIAVVGDVKAKDVIKYAEKYFGKIPAGPPVERIQTVEPPQLGERRVAVEDPSQAVWIAGYHVPAITHPDRPALDALIDYLGSGRTSLLYKKLVKETAKQLGIQSRTKIAKMTARSEADVQASAARLLGNIPGKDSTASLMKALKDKKLGSDKPLVLTAVIDALGRLGHVKAEPMVKSEFRKFREENVHRACVIYFGRIETKDRDVVRALCEQLESPQPANVDSASNPPASYWKERWRVWQVTRRDVSWALQEITGQRFQPGEGGQPGDGEKALRWLEENGKKLGIK